MSQIYSATQVLELLTPLINSLNQEMPFKLHPFSAQETHPLLSREGQLDSLSLVAFLIRVEDYLEQKTQKQIQLANDRAFSAKNSPFLTLGSLCHFVAELLNEDSQAA